VRHQSLEERPNVDADYGLVYVGTAELALRGDGSDPAYDYICYMRTWNRVLAQQELVNVMNYGTKT
jgi:hypothetical protein